MKQPDTNSTTLAIAERLLAYEAAARDASEAEAPAGSRVCQKLGDSLGKLIGLEGFRAVLRRALTLATRETENLKGVTLTADGCLQGLNGHAEDVFAVLVSHVINLTVRFLGEPLTVKLVQDAWPEETEVDRAFWRKERT